MVQIGKSGLSESVKNAIDEQLLAHELIKVRRASDCPMDKNAIAAAIEADLGCRDRPESSATPYFCIAPTRTTRALSLS